MARLRRRNMLIGLGTIVFGASGFVASGAFNLGSEGSLGDDWVQVAGVDQAITTLGEDTPDVQTRTDDGDGEGDGSQDDGEQGSEEGSDETDGDDGADEDEGTEADDQQDTATDQSDTTDTPGQAPTDTPAGTEVPEDTDTDTDDDDDDGDDDDGDDDGPSGTPEDSTTTTRVQVVTDPGNTGNLVSRLDWDGQMSGSPVVEGTDDGFLRAFDAGNANRDAVSRVGYVTGEGYPDGRYAFLIGNVGDPNTPGRGGGPVELAARLLDGNGGTIGETPQINFPYRVVDSGNTFEGQQGTDLLDVSGVTIPVGGVVEVVLEIDSGTGTSQVEKAEALAFFAPGEEGGR